jgi:hypothetical protein
MGGSGKLLPRVPLPEIVTAELALRVPGCVFTSNPCRIKLYSREVVIFREDICAKMRKYSRRPQEDEEETSLHKHALRTILSQSHLSPLPLEVTPIDWAHDHTLRLYPLPHVLVLGGRGSGFVENEKNVWASNPGCFGTDFSFAVYHPSAEGKDKEQEPEATPEMELLALNGDDVDRETAKERVRDDRPQRKKRRRITNATVAAGTVTAAAQEEAAAITAGVQKTPKDRQPSRRRKDTPNAARSTVAPLGAGQRGIGGYFKARLDEEKADPPLLSRRRLTRATDSDDEEGRSSDDGQEVNVVEDMQEDGGEQEEYTDGESAASEDQGDSEPEPAPVRISKTAAPARARRVLHEDSDTD